MKVAVAAFYFMLILEMRGLIMDISRLKSEGGRSYWSVDGVNYRTGSRDRGVYREQPSGTFWFNGKGGFAPQMEWVEIVAPEDFSLNFSASVRRKKLIEFIEANKSVFRAGAKVVAVK